MMRLRVCEGGPSGLSEKMPRKRPPTPLEQAKQQEEKAVKGESACMQCSALSAAQHKSTLQNNRYGVDLFITLLD